MQGAQHFVMIALSGCSIHVRGLKYCLAASVVFLLCDTVCRQLYDTLLAVLAAAAMSVAGNDYTSCYSRASPIFICHLFSFDALCSGTRHQHVACSKQCGKHAQIESSARQVY
jgi:hypothetical protein